MSIWFKPFTLKDLTTSRYKTMVDHIAIEFTEIGNDFLRVKMPIDERTRQPMGVVHGGASCALAETLGSIAGNFCIDQEKRVCVGLEINTSHLKMVKNGFVIGTAKPAHIGRSTQLWEIEVHDEAGQLVPISRLRLSVLDKNK